MSPNFKNVQLKCLISNGRFFSEGLDVPNAVAPQHCTVQQKVAEKPALRLAFHIKNEPNGNN